MALGIQWSSFEPPFALSEDTAGHGAEDVLATLSSDTWLFPPRSDQPQAPPAAVAHRARPDGYGLPVPPRPDLPPPVPETPAPVFRYDFQYLRSPQAQDVVRQLLTTTPPGQSRARQVGRNLKIFAGQAYHFLLGGQGGRSLIADEERNALLQEGERALKRLVEAGAISVGSDLILCLEAFDVSRGHRKEEQVWLCGALERVLGAALDVADEVEASTWRNNAALRIQHEPELYTNVDVRAWPHILNLVNRNHSVIHSESFSSQVRLQLCNFSNAQLWYEGLRQAAQLVAELHQVTSFDAGEITEIFNNAYFDRHHRRQLLGSVLQGAPRELVQEVLRLIDGVVELGERSDDEIILVRQLLVDLNEDIRCCRNTFFKMKSDWLAGRWTGVVVSEELSPEQICDHIDDDANYEDLLKVCVNRYLKNSRKFEAAKMLARPASQGTRVFETNRNDKQLAYLVSLYQDLDPPIDHFGPMEEGCLALPCPRSIQEVPHPDNLFYIDDHGEFLDQLERETLGSRSPLTMGVWWLWRCFDPKLDLWPRASFIAIAYEQKFYIVDLVRLEENGALVEERSKRIICAILAAPHVLKIVHAVDKNSLVVLQRALLTHEESMRADAVLPHVTPVIDLVVVAAYARRTKPGAHSVSKLSGLTFDYLRLELCLAEALGNFERRPIRMSQQHYALSLAWSPLMILKVLCSHDIVRLHEVKAMAFSIGLPGASTSWSEALGRMPLCSDPVAELDDDGVGGIPGAYGQNLWEDPEWRRQIPQPDTEFDLAGAFHSRVPQLVLPADQATMAEHALRGLFDVRSTKCELDVLYQAYLRMQGAYESR